MAACDIVLVNMPHLDIQCPSMALGRLKSLIEREGFRCRVEYANLLFAEECGGRLFAQVFRHRKHCLGDWLFARAAFVDEARSDEEYLEFFLRQTRGRQSAGDELRDTLLTARESAEAFLDRLVDRILRFQPPAEEVPLAVGCTSIFLQHVPALALLRRLKGRSPRVVTLMGGPGCETVAGLATHRCFEWVDYVVSGEADHLIGPLLEIILGRGGRGEMPRHRSRALPPGVFGPACRVEGYPAGDAARASVSSLAGLPPPDYEDYFATLEECSQLREVVCPALPFETSRGCWWGQRLPCTFCGDNGAALAYRRRPPGEAVAELDVLSERHGVQRFVATDNAMDPAYLDEFLPVLAARGAPFRLFYEIRPNLNRNQVALLARAGVRWMQPGLESLDTRALRLMNKGTEGWRNIQVLRWCRQSGVRCTWMWLHGIPDEKDEWYATMADLVPLLTHLQPPRAMNLVHFCRNSPYHEHAAEYGLRLDPAEVYQTIYPLGEAEIRDLAFTFEEEGRLVEAEDPLAFVLHQGRDRLRGEVTRWQAGFWSNEPPRLVMTVSDGAVDVEDTRPAVAESTHRLTGLERDLLLACDDAPRVDACRESFRNYPEAEIDAAVTILREAGLILELDGRWISLVLTAPPAPLPDVRENPCGWVDWERLTAHDPGSRTGPV